MKLLTSLFTIGWLLLSMTDVEATAYHQWTNADRGTYCHGCTYEQMERGIEENFTFRIIDRNRDGVPDGPGPDITHRFNLIIFDKTRTNYVRYHVTHKPFRNYLDYYRLPELAASKPNFEAAKADYYSYQEWIQTQWTNFLATLPKRTPSQRSEDECPNGDTSPNDAMDSLFDAVSGAFDGANLTQLAHDMNTSEREWHEEDCVLCRLSSGQLFVVGFGLDPDHDNQVVYNFPDGQAVYTVRPHTNHNGPRFTLNLSDSTFTIPQSVWIPGIGETSNVDLNLNDFFYWDANKQEYVLRNNAPLVISPCFNRHLEQALETMMYTFEGNSNGNFAGTNLNSEQCRTWPQERTHSTTFLMPATRPCDNGRPGCVTGYFIPIQYFVTRSFMQEVCGF